MTPEIKAEFQMFVPEDDGSAMDWLENTLTQDHAALHTRLVAAVEGVETEERDEYGVKYKSAKALKQDFLTIINSIFKE